MIAAILLIAAGLVLLLNNLGVVDWSVWQALSKLWPLILIGVGLDLMFGKRRLLSLLVGLAVLVLLVAGLVLFGREKVQIVSMQVSIPRENTPQASLSLNTGLAALDVRAGAGAGMLLAGTVEHPEGEPVEVENRRDQEGQVQRVRLSQESRGLRKLLWREHEPVWHLLLPADQPLELKVQTGVGSARLDLEGVELRLLEVQNDVGDTRVNLPGHGRYAVRVKGGVGHLELTVPRGFPVRIQAHAGLGSVHVAGDWSRSGRLWSSPGFDEAASGAELEIRAGVGSIEVKQVEAAAATAAD